MPTSYNPIAIGEFTSGAPFGSTGVPSYGPITTTNFTPSAGGTTAGDINTQQFPQISNLTQLLNQLNLGAQQNANTSRIPGEAGLEGESSANISSELAGQLPPSVTTLLQQQAAERGVSEGSPGSDTSNAAYLQSLGLTDLSLMNQGQSDLTAAAGRNPVAPLFNPSNMFISPYEAGTLANQFSNNELNWLSSLFGGLGGTGGSPYGGRPSPTGTPTAAQPSNSDFLNSLFPSTPGTGTDTSGFTYGVGDTSTTTVPGATLVQSSGFDPSQLGFDTLGTDTGSQNYFGIDPNTMDPTAGYDPFGLYTDTSGFGG